jgi:predicted transcriptional regulator
VYVKRLPEMKRDLLIAKRETAKELHEKGCSNRKIARYLVASKDSVGKWVQMEDMQKRK